MRRSTIVRISLVAPGAVAVALAASLSIASVAHADATARYYGLYAMIDSKIYNDNPSSIVGEIDRTTTTNNLNQKLTIDASGDRQAIKAPLRDRYGPNGLPVYTRVEWYSNGGYCYNSPSVGVSVGLGVEKSGGPSGQVGVTFSTNGSCTSGWNYKNETTAGWTNSTSWVFTTHNKAFDSDKTANSFKGYLNVCQDNPLWMGDYCAYASRVLGSSF